MSNRYSALSALLVLFLALMSPTLAVADETEGKTNGKQPLSLITASPDDGFALAVTLARRSVTTMQQNKDILHSERPEYAESADGLIAASHVVAVWFDTIARANDYWRE